MLSVAIGIFHYLHGCFVLLHWLIPIRNLCRSGPCGYPNGLHPVRPMLKPVVAVY